MSPKLKCQQYWNCQQNWIVTRTEMSLTEMSKTEMSKLKCQKLECQKLTSQTEMKPKLKWHQNWNATKR